jgi:valyl-tRNA synthetase
MSTDATRAPQVPDKPTLDGVEATWSAAWEDEGTYRFNPQATRAEVFSIDTPPPTVSGSLHMGSVFGYVQTDALARYRRMSGWELFYPMGWDDNGLPTERRVQTYFGVRCDPSLPYDPDFEPPAEPGKEDIPVSRPNFIDLCHRLTAEDELTFEALWRRIGLSVDWTRSYATIDDRSRRASQRMFLRNLARGEAYSAEAPTLWDVDYQTAVAQAEMEDRERLGAYHRLRFDDLEIDTTRPELVAACVALVAHPDDARFAARFGTTVHTPIFGVEVPIVSHHLADPEKGSGIAMICTFGDVTDVIWWRELQLPTRSIITREGRIVETPPPGVPDGPAWKAIAGRTVKAAQRTMVELLTESGDLLGPPRNITHPVKFYERGDRPLEIVTSRQWYLRNGGRDAALREALLQRGNELQWHPPYMQVRYENWVNGLNSDWLISRQRYFGVPLPVWYPVSADGAPDHAHPIVPAEASLPVDPTTDVPVGYEAAQRGVPRGFVGDPDVMDTWATSSLTLRSPADGRTTRPSLPQPSRWTCDPRDPRSSGRGSSPRRCAPIWNTTRFPGTTPPSTVGCSIPITRRSRSPRGMRSRRCPSSTNSVPTRCGTGRATVAREPTLRWTPAS